MGVSTNAYLFYGFALGDQEYGPGEWEHPWAEDESFEEWAADRLGVEDWNALPFEVVSFCSSEYPMYAMAAKGSVIRAFRGDVEDVPVPLPDFTEQAVILRDAAKNLGLEGAVLGAVRWILVSDWA